MTDNITFNGSELAAFYANLDRHKDHLHMLRLRVLAAELRAQELKELFDAAEADALKDLGDTVSPVKTGLDLSGDEFERWNARSTEICAARGYSEPDGRYKPGFNQYEIQRTAENELINFQLSILPKKIREAIAQGIKDNYTMRQKFLAITMGVKEGRKIIKESEVSNAKQ